jgi:hypothetical protein
MQEQAEDLSIMTEMSQTEFAAIQALGVATPVLTGLSVLLFLVFTGLLVFRTQHKGRLLIGLGLILLCGVGVLQWYWGMGVGTGLLDSMLARFLPVIGLFLIVLGYARLVWSLLKLR